MSDRHSRIPDERCDPVGKDTTCDAARGRKNTQQPDEYRPKGETRPKSHDDDDDDDEDIK